jgi:hypothetical protein
VEPTQNGVRHVEYWPVNIGEGEWKREGIGTAESLYHWECVTQALTVNSTCWIWKELRERKRVNQDDSSNKDKDQMMVHEGDQTSERERERK